MFQFQLKITFYKFLFLFLFCNFSTFSQTKDSTQIPRFFTGICTATNNGISLIPSFSLGRPAALFDLSIGKGRLSFDPMLRFGLNGKPWSFIFWWRYKLINQKKFFMPVGAHPSFIFRDEKIIKGGVPIDGMAIQRYFAWEAVPTYVFNKKTSVALSYLGSHGLTKDIVQYTTFLAFRGTFSNISLSKNYSFTFIPQVYYLKMDKLDGKYANFTLFLQNKNYPVSISTIMSKAIDTEIAGKDFIWNIALNYHINSRFNRIH